MVFRLFCHMVKVLLRAPPSATLNPRSYYLVHYNRLLKLSSQLLLYMTIQDKSEVFPAKTISS